MKTTNFVRQLQARATVARPATADVIQSAGGDISSSASAATAGAQDGAQRQALNSQAQNKQHNHNKLNHHQAHYQLQQLQQLQYQQFQIQHKPIQPKQPSLEERQQQQLEKLLAQHELKAFEAAAATAPAPANSARDSLDLTFSDTRLAYKSKTMRDLLRNYFVLGLCKSDFLVKNNERIMKWSQKVLGKRAFELLMRQTFYGQFVAGEDEQDIVPVIRHLSSFGVKTILDYSAEEDVREEEVKEDARAEVERNKDESSYLATHFGSKSPLRRYQLTTDFADRRKYLPVARTYFYHGESQCERNLEIFFKSIEAVAKTTGNTGFAAIKLTALGRPKLLMKISKIIDYMRSIEGYSRPESLADLLQRFNSLEQSDINPLDEDEEEMLFNLMRRVNRIAAYASQVGGARCMIDAEQTYMQPAIRMIAMELMRQYNRREPIIFNTYQCYLKAAFDHVRQDLALARRENFFFGAKLVRGAYMDQERARAAKLGYEDPINESFEATTKMYEQTLAYLMGEIERELKLANMDKAATAAAKNSAASGDSVVRQLDLMNSRRISIMVASHNEETVRFALKQMERRGIEPWHRLICFGQLYGMCDHVSFVLGQSGYSVYKYAPYGPIAEVLPYLGRRAIENHGFMSKLDRERSLLAKEILKRVATLRLFTKAQGNYTPA